MSQFVPTNKYGNPLPRSERWGDIIYNLDQEEKQKELQAIRAKLATNYERSLTAPNAIKNPVENDMIKNKNGFVYKWMTKTTRNNRGRPLGPHWQKVIDKFGYYTNISDAMALERKHGIRFNRMINNLKRSKKTRKNRRSTRRRQTRRS